jgi:hypothetical protein
MFWRLMHNLAAIFYDMFDRVCEKPLKNEKSPLARAFLYSFEMRLILQQAQHVLLRGVGLRQHRSRSLL